MLETTNENGNEFDSLATHVCPWDEIERRWKKARDKGCRFGYMYMDSFEIDIYYDFSCVPAHEDVFDHIASFCDDCIHIPEVFVLDHDLDDQKIRKYYLDTADEAPKTLRGTEIPWPDQAAKPENPAILLPDRENIFVAGKVAMDNRSKFILVIRNDWLYQDWYMVLMPPKYNIYETIPAIHGVLENRVVGIYNPEIGIELQIEKLRFVGQEPSPESLAYTPEDLQMRLRGLLGLYLIYMTSDPRSLEAKFFWKKAWELISTLKPKDMIWAMPQIQKLILVASVMGVKMPEEALTIAGVEDWPGQVVNR